jgi:hypothetical protein
MSPFTGPLSVTQCDVDWRRWRLNEALQYEVHHLGSGMLIRVPGGFETDGASIPRPLWALLPTWGRYSRAAVVHDWLCEALKTGRPHRYGRTYAEAAAVFREAMKVCGVGGLARWGMWAAVRLHFALKGQR